MVTTSRYWIRLNFLSPWKRDSLVYFSRGKRLSTYDGIIPRIGASITFYGTAVVRQFEQMGVFTLNSSQSIMTSRDKLRSMQILSRHRIGLPATAFVRNKQDVLPAIERVGGAPVIIKLLEGTQGIGVILADTGSVAAAIIETLQSTKQNVLIQKFVAESKGRDVRAFVVGDRVVAAMRRRAQGQEFRSNVHRGGTTEMVKLDPAYEQTAVRATQNPRITCGWSGHARGRPGAPNNGGQLVSGTRGYPNCNGNRHRRYYFRIHGTTSAVS